MPRKNIIRTSHFPYHVTARCNNKDWYSLPLPQVWSIYEYCLINFVLEFGIEVYTFVLMGNHFHLILRTPQENIDKGMQFFMRESSLAIGRSTNRINRIYGGRYKGSLLAKELYFFYALKYVLRNPIKANICDRVEDYPFSSSYSGLGNLKKFLTPPHIGSTNLLLDWLNTSTPREIEESTKKGLKRTEFKLARKSNGRTLLVDLLQCTPKSLLAPF